MRLPFGPVILTMVLTCSALAQIPGVPEYSSEMVTTSPKGAVQMKGKIYFSHGKTRMDLDSSGQNVTIISDGPGKTSYMVMPEQHMYMEMRADNPMMKRGPKVPDVKQFLENPCANDPDVTCKKTGTETVNDRSADKWEFVSKADGKVTSTVWIDQKTHMPVRVVSADGNITDFKNFKEGPQDAALFQVPAGYQKLDMGSMMGRPDKDR